MRNGTYFLVILGLLGSMCCRGEAADTSLSPPPPGTRFEFGGVVGERIKANVDNWLVPAPEANPGIIEMFHLRDRKPVPQLVPWAGEFVGKYLIGAVQHLRMSNSEALRETVKRTFEQLYAAQDTDGYLGPFRKEERLLGALSERIRDVRAGPDGAIWLLTDNSSGRILRVTPAK